MKELILDTETTGLDPKEGHRIVEIAALEMKNKILTGNKFHFYVNPQRDMPTEAYRIHGISGEFLKDKALFSDIADEFLRFIEGGKLVIHNAVFDINFINYELSLLNKPTLELSCAIDTLAIARKMFPGMKASLDALCKRFKIDNSFRKFHGALKDAALLAEVYIEMSGGRQVSFSINNGAQQIADRIAVEGTSLNSKKTIVIKPTKEELRNHKNFLATISGNGWLN